MLHGLTDTRPSVPYTGTAIVVGPNRMKKQQSANTHLKNKRIQELVKISYSYDIYIQEVRSLHWFVPRLEYGPSFIQRFEVLGTTKQTFHSVLFRVPYLSYNHYYRNVVFEAINWKSVSYLTGKLMQAPRQLTGHQNTTYNMEMLGIICQ